MRILSALAAIAIIASPAFADHAKVTKRATVPVDTRLPAHEPDTYRFGYPYNILRGTSPGQCEQMCNRDQSCAAWSFVPATFQVGPRCELKRSVGSQINRPGAVSGIAIKFHPVPQRSVQAPAAQTSVRQTYRPAPQAAPRPVQTTRIMSAPQPAPAQPYQMKELMGGPTTVRSGQDTPGRITRAPAPQPAPVAAPTVYAGPRPLTQMPNAVTRRPAAPQPAQPATRPAPPPARPVPQFQMVPEDEMAPAPAPVQATAPVATAPTSTGGVAISPAAPIQNRRKPWTERSNGDPDYSVGDSGFIPGDEEATAGFVDGLPEANEE